MGSKKKWLFNVVFFILILALTLYGVFHNEDPRELLRLLDRANGWYWIAGIPLVVLFISGESLILRILFHHVGERPKRGHCLIYSFIGFFFSSITPAAGGGQPIQIYYMHKDGLDPGITAPILVIVTIFYKLVLVLYGLVVMICRPAKIILANDGALWWCMAGWILNVLVISLFVMLIFFPQTVEKVLKTLIRWASRFISASRLEKWHSKLEESMLKYREVTHCIQHNLKLVLLIFAISILQRTILFTVTWLVLESFGITGVSWFTVVSMQAMVCLGTDLLPLPGGTGANEALFVLLFGGICGEDLTVPVLIASRGISYYGQLIVSGLVTLFAGYRLGKRKLK